MTVIEKLVNKTTIPHHAILSMVNKILLMHFPTGYRLTTIVDLQELLEIYQELFIVVNADKCLFEELIETDYFAFTNKLPILLSSIKNIQNALDCSFRNALALSINALIQLLLTSKDFSDRIALISHYNKLITDNFKEAVTNLLQVDDADSLLLAKALGSTMTKFANDFSIFADAQALRTQQQRLATALITAQVTANEEKRTLQEVILSMTF